MHPLLNDGTQTNEYAACILAFFKHPFEQHTVEQAFAFGFTIQSNAALKYLSSASVWNTNRSERFLIEIIAKLRMKLNAPR